jgi:hypothetical protein
VSGPRFPGYDVLSERESWDEATRAAIEQRLRVRCEPAFFDKDAEATCRALLARLLGDPPTPVFEQLDERLALGITDGYRYEEMPPDAEAWRVSLRELDRLAQERHQRRFHELTPESQDALLAGVKQSECLGPLPMHRLWTLWMRYACAAYYSHPHSWSEIGFGGPAYPRGYKNLGVDRREPWEVADAHPGDDARQKRA